MKILSTESKKIELNALDLELQSMIIDYDMARRCGGKEIEVRCTTFLNESKRDLGQGLITNVPALVMIITKEEKGIAIRSNFNKDVSQFPNETFEVSEAFVEKWIKLQYENSGYTFEVVNDVEPKNEKSNVQV